LPDEHNEWYKHQGQVKIVKAYRGFKDVERFAHVAELEEIQGNDFNLNISRCVDTTDPVELIPVEEALAQLRVTERRRDEAVAKMDELLAKMGYAR
jgi:type I restriction enzyme M protein